MASSAYDSWVSNPDEDNGPLLSITVWSLTGVSFVFLLVRLFIRYSQRKLWVDDFVLSMSWLTLLSQAIINQLTVNLGFGKHILDINFDNMDRIAYFGVSALSIAVAAITLSKISFGVTLLRLMDGWRKIWVYFAIGTLAIFAVPAVILPWVQCKPMAKTFVGIVPGTCIDRGPSLRYARFQAIWAAIMDISLAFLPWKMIWGLQMRLAEKIGVCLAMSLGVVAGAASIIRARYIDLLAEQDVSYDAYNSIIWSVADTAMTIVATSMPVLRVVVTRAVHSAFENYQNSTSRNQTNSGTGKSRVASTGPGVSLRQSSGKTPDLLQMSSQEILADRLGEDSKDYLELEERDVIIDERTGRITSATAGSMPDAIEHKVRDWPLER